MTITYSDTLLISGISEPHGGMEPHSLESHNAGIIQLRYLTCVVAGAVKRIEIGGVMGWTDQNGADASIQVRLRICDPTCVIELC